MSFQQQNSRDMKKPGLGYGHCKTQTDNKPFSIRHYVWMSRQKNIAQSWPFPQKYLKLCHNHGISSVLPPLETPSLLADGLQGLPVIDFSLKEKETDDFSKIHHVEMDEAEKILKPGKDSSLKDRINLLRHKLSHLSLSTDGYSSIGHEQPLEVKVDAQASGNQSFKVPNASHKNMGNKGRRRKGRTKKKSLAEILAVAKHCILDGHDRIYVSCGSSSVSQLQNADKERGRKVNHMAGGTNLESPRPIEGYSLMKKHQRCDDSGIRIGQFSKRSRTMEINRRYGECKLKSWSRNMNSCKTAETEKPEGYEIKARETFVPISAVKLQDHRAY